MSESGLDLFDSAEISTARAADLQREIMRLKKEKKALEAQLEISLASLKDMESFVSVAAHDLQNPLRKVQCYLDLLNNGSGGLLDESGARYLQILKKNTAHLSNLMEGLLNYARAASGSLNMEWIAFQDVLQDVLQESRIKIDSTKAEIHFPAKCPSVLAQPMMMYQLWHHLLDNALTYNEEKPCQIRIECQERPDEWIFSVRDNGIGIAAEEKEKIFLPFYRSPVRKENPGSGLGLSICKKVVERHGGRIWVESEAGAGSAFYFSLPIKGKGPG